jgi:hypothetical protein
MTTPLSSLKKKHNSLAYHHVCEAIAAGILCILKVSGKKNLANLLTKPLPSGNVIILTHKVLDFPNAYIS